MKLSAEERDHLEKLVSGGKHPAQWLSKARILLKADVGEPVEGWSDSQIARSWDTGLATIARTPQQLVEEGFEAVLTRKHALAQLGQKADFRRRRGSQADCARLFRAAGRSCALDAALLEDKVVELNSVSQASNNTISSKQKNNFKPRLKEQFVIPPDAKAAFVAAMGDVLEV